MSTSLRLVLGLLLYLLQCPTWLCSPLPRHAIIYSGPTTPNNPHTVRLNDLYLQNLFFFLSYGLRCSADSAVTYDIFLVLSAANIKLYDESFQRLITTTSCNTVRFIPQDRTCYDVGNYKTALAAIHVKKYDYFTFLNCGLLGPFQEDYGSFFWPQRFRSKLNDITKLVGITAHCGGATEHDTPQSHVQSMIWTTDAQGLHSIVDSGVFFECTFNGTNTKSSYNHLRQSLINTYELGLSRSVMQHGFQISVLNSYQNNLHFSIDNATKKPFPKNCYDLWQPDYLYRMKKFHSVNPYDLMFWKNTRRHSIEALNHFDGILKEHGIHVKNLKIELTTT